MQLSLYRFFRSVWNRILWVFSPETLPIGYKPAIGKKPKSFWHWLFATEHCEEKRMAEAKRQGFWRWFWEKETLS